MRETMTETMMKLNEDDRQRLLNWIVTEQSILGEEITLTISKWNTGPIATVKAKITEVKGLTPSQE